MAAAVERTLTINLRKEVMKVPAHKRAKKAVTAVREHLQRHMKAAAENIRIGKHLNLKLWEHGIKNPVHKVTVLAKKDDKGIVTAELPNIPVKKQREKKGKQPKQEQSKEEEGAKAKEAPKESAKAGKAGEEEEKAAK